MRMISHIRLAETPLHACVCRASALMCVRTIRRDD